MSRVITLTDGPHNLALPTSRELATLQKLGYPIAQQFSPAVLTTGGDDPEWDLTAMSDHIAALLPDDYDADRVVGLLDIGNLSDYYTALREVADEAFGGDSDPKAPSTPSPK